MEVRLSAIPLIIGTEYTTSAGPGVTRIRQILHKRSGPGEIIRSKISSLRSV